MKKFSFIIIVNLLLITSSYSQVIFKQSSVGLTAALPSIRVSDQVMVSIPDLCSQLGFTWKWDLFSQQLVCSKNAIKIVFMQGVNFCMVDSTIIQLIYAPERKGGSLYCNVNELVRIFNSCLSQPLTWNPTEKTISFTYHNFSIKSVNCEQKQNGTLVSIDLTDSLPFDYTYFYPNLVISFYNGTVDTALIKQGKNIGLIDSVFTVQFQKSAQVSLMLRNEIEDPQVDYVQDTRRIMISLRPRKHATSTTPTPVVYDETKFAKLTIVIDPGHGGKDPGAIGAGGVKEKDVVLAIGLRLRDLLKKKSSISVYMTRDKDVFIPLNERTKFSNKKKADLFISIHADAIPGPSKRQQSTRGYKVYFLSHAKNEEDKLVAMRENAVIELEEKPQSYDNLHNVLIDLAGNEYLRESQELCILLDQQFDLSLKKISRLHLGVGQANFWVLNGAYMPSVLIEAGFLSHSEEEKLLADSEFQKKIASSICNAIMDFQQNFETGL